MSSFSKSQITSTLVRNILNLKKEKPLIVAISGIDGAGKTYFTKNLVKDLEQKHQSVVTTSVDYFHNPQEIRYQKGKDSPEEFYYDSYNYEKLKELLLEPVMSDQKYCKTRFFDCEKNQQIISEPVPISKDTILIIEGIFLFRPELIQFWDYKIFLDVSFETALERDISRSSKNTELVKEKYSKRYKAGQMLFLKEAKPKKVADVIIDNNDYDKPFII